MPDHDVLQAIHERRSIKDFTDRAVDREAIETLLEAAVQAPNHRMTEPWHFVVLGPKSRRAYAEALAGRKTRTIDEPDVAEKVRQKVLRGHGDVPCMIAVVMDQAEDPEIREEDYAACYMAVQNMSLAAVALGLGTHIKSGAVMDDRGLRDALDVADGRRIACVVFVGDPVDVPDPKPRSSAAERTRWLD